MILEEIEVENFLSYGHGQLSFTDSRLWLINGENGAGKSALFDALEYAIYGEHRGRGQNHELLVKQGAQRAKITVVFSHHGTRYRVIREIDYRSGNKGGRIAIWDPTANYWVPENVGDGARAVWSWLKPRIPSHDLFCSAILLRQNNTAHFLDGTEGDRNKRFAALINLERYTELSQKAQELTRKAELERELARQRSKELGDLSDEVLQQLAALLQAATDDFASADAAYKQAQQVVRDAEAWAHLQMRHQQQERLAQDIQALLSAEGTIRAAARRVKDWDQVVLRLERYWGRRAEADARYTEIAAKRAEAEQAERERQNVANDLVATSHRLAALERDELPAAHEQAEAAQTYVLYLEHERKIAVVREQAMTLQRDVERLAGADTTYASWQNRGQVLPRLQDLADARKGLEEAEHAVPPAQAAFDDAAQKANETHERLSGIEREQKEAVQCRDQIVERIVQLKADIARLDGQIASHGRLTGQERECPVCAQVLNEATFRHVQEKLKGEHADLEQKRAELDTQAQPTLKRANALMKQLQNTHIEQQKKIKTADEAKGRESNNLIEVTTKLQMARIHLARTQAAVLAETPSLAERIAEVDCAWVAGERAAITAALPAARESAQQLKETQDAYREVRATVVTLHDQRNPGTDPLGDNRTSSEIATLVQKAATKASICKRRVTQLEQEHVNLAQQATAQAETHARLAERVTQAQQQAARLDEEAQTARREADQLYDQLRSEWQVFLKDRVTYDAEKQTIETLRPNAERVAELDQARGRLQGVEGELQRIAAEEGQIRLEHRLPVEQAKQAETDTGQHLATMRQRQDNAASAIDTFQQKRQANETYRQEMERADRDVTAFSQLAELLKSDGPIQKAIIEQERRRIAIEANNILALLNDPLCIHIDQARRRQGTDVTFIDTSDAASGDASAPNRSRRYFEFLSGGEQFRVALALALALHRLVAGDTAGTLIVDEGFGALDSNRRDHLALQMANMSQGILSRNLVHSLIICSHSTEVQHHFRDSCWIVEKQSGTASVRRAEGEYS